MAMLEIKDLSVFYGVIQALKGISFEVNEGEVIALIGANGAGKTTTLHTLTGILPAKSGSIMFNGTELTKTPAHKIVSRLQLVVRGLPRHLHQRCHSFSPGDRPGCNFRPGYAV